MVALQLPEFYWTPKPKLSGCRTGANSQTLTLGTLTLVLLCPAILDVAFEGLGECFVNCCGSQVKNIAADPGKHGISRNPNNGKPIALCGINMSVRQCVAAGSRVLQTCRALPLICCVLWANYLTSLNLKVPVYKIGTCLTELLQILNKIRHVKYLAQGVAHDRHLINHSHFC